MAEVEKVSAAAEPQAAAATALNQDESTVVEVNGTIATELGTSPTQERSSNSHPHDSEYDTASDLEGGEEYDDEDLDDDDIDEDGESLSDEDDDEDDDLDDEEHGNADTEERSESDAQKKVDEDRSNPQYIPKRGTFYEHDDRTVDVVVDDTAESVDGVSISQDDASKSSQSQSTISRASKTMKKWQPASGGDRWSHDRFEASEQAPKSRSELVNAYGYDIRTEDAPPRARRRRRYGRGPSKYSRNWEDENAYLKASNKERKPPRPSDFPALNERGARIKKPGRGIREEKENRMEKRQISNLSDENMSAGPIRNSHSGDRRERNDDKFNRGKSFGRPKNSSTSVRQAPMEFKNKSKNSGPPQSQSNHSNNRQEMQYDRQVNRSQNSSFSVSISNDQAQQLKPGTSKGQNSSSPLNQNSKHSQINESYNNNSTNIKTHEQNYQQQHQTQQTLPAVQMQTQHQQPNQTVSMRQSLPPKNTTPIVSNLSQRLQQVQNRNDPSYVGSVQMHTLASQNQMVAQAPQQLQHQQQVNMLQQQTPQQIPQEHRGPKRYSSIRRNQHEAQHIAEQQQQQPHLQQLQHLQQQPQPQAQPLIVQDQHMLMQLYHQEAQMQAQMQALQVSQAPVQPKPYAAVPTVAPQVQPYYVTTPDAYTAATTVGAQASQAAAYAQGPLAYPNAPPPTAQAVPGSVAVPAVAYGPQITAVPPVVTAAPVSSAGAPAQPASSSNANYTNYQNYNTVGGTTYFVPPPAQAPTNRPVVLPQRRPIPILKPSEKSNKEENKTQANISSSSSSTASSTAPIGSAENIDHILDNMFVQRPAFQPPQASAVTPVAAAAVAQTNKTSTPTSSEQSGNTTDSTYSSEDSLKTSTDFSNTNESGLVENNINNNAIAAQD